VEFRFQFLLLVLKDSQGKHKMCQNYSNKHFKWWLREQYGLKPQCDFFLGAVSGRVDDLGDLSVSPRALAQAHIWNQACLTFMPHSPVHSNMEIKLCSRALLFVCMGICSRADSSGWQALAQIGENPTADQSSADNSLLIIFKPIRKSSFSTRDELRFSCTALAK